MAIGTVKFFNTNRGYGFITSEDGMDAFVHISAVQRAGIKTLRPGQRVSYEVVQDERGNPTADNVALSGPHGTGDDPRG